MTISNNGFLHACRTLLVMVLLAPAAMKAQPANKTASQHRQRININNGWRFFKYDGQPDSLLYEERPAVTRHNDNVVADTRANLSEQGVTSARALKPWILPTANPFIKDTAKHHQRPAGNPGGGFPYVQSTFNDAGWTTVNLPHDWAAAGPFYKGANAVVGGGMGRLPSPGVAWYRKTIHIPAASKGKQVYLDVDGAMSYAMVWCNGILVGGWPYGYNSFRLNLTPYIQYGAGNQLAIRIDNPNYSARWYPGGGLYRNVWLTITNPVQVDHWGTSVTTSKVSKQSATVHLNVRVKNNTTNNANVALVTDVFAIDPPQKKIGAVIASFKQQAGTIAANSKKDFTANTVIKMPRLWGPPPAQQPNMYMAVTKVLVDGKQVDVYETPFGIRDVQFHPTKGIMVNGQAVRVQGVNQHHDLGALGAAFNTRAAERQLEILRNLGCNAIRLAHNPPAPELLDLTDRMGFLVIDEVFDCWQRGKTPHDFHLIFNDWAEADVRSFIRRDRNHPSVIAWSFGNEVGEQYTGDEGAAVAKMLYDIVRDEDSTRPATASMNYAKPDMPFPAVMDIISLNYQGEGIRDAPAYSHLKGIKTQPLYAAFQKQFPNKLIVSSETASALSTRGTYVFPVYNGISAPVSDSTGGDPVNEDVSAYELYTAQFGSSADKVFATQDKHPFVTGEFVWSGWDYLGEPTPYYAARSSYSGIIDLAGFKKDRYYLYQARWRPDLPMAHLLPHWTWPGREGQVTPVHVFTSGDEAELFLNGKSLGRKKKGAFEYRLRWDDVTYTPGTLVVVAYKNGRRWATDTVQTAGAAARLQAVADRQYIKADGSDLAFITVQVLDDKGVPVPTATHQITFTVTGGGQLVATDNGDPADLEAFPSAQRKAYSGMALAIVRFTKGSKMPITVKASAQGLKAAAVVIHSKQKQ